MDQIRIVSHGQPHAVMISAVLIGLLHREPKPIHIQHHSCAKCPRSMDMMRNPSPRCGNRLELLS